MMHCWLANGDTAAYGLMELMSSHEEKVRMHRRFYLLLGISVSARTAGDVAYDCAWPEGTNAQPPRSLIIQTLKSSLSNRIFGLCITSRRALLQIRRSRWGTTVTAVVSAQNKKGWKCLEYRAVPGVEPGTPPASEAGTISLIRVESIIFNA